jgi:predicted metalloendopeptidase
MQKHGGFDLFNPHAPCVCCNNPWSRAESGADAFAVVCGECPPPADVAFTPADLDTSKSPHDDFFEYANGGWMKSNPIPPEYPNWNTFLALHTQNQERLKAMLAELQQKAAEVATAGGAAADDEATKLALFYAAAMDEDAVEAAGTTPMVPLLKLCTAAKDPAQRVAALGQLYSEFGVSAFFNVGADPDAKNSDHCIAQVAQGGLGLLDRDYYFDEDKADKRELYKAHVAKVLQLIVPEAYAEDGSAAVAAEAVYALELALATSHMTKTEKRDPEATYNKMSLGALVELGGEGGFEFSAWFDAIGKPTATVGDVNVCNVEAVKAVGALIPTVEPATLEHYLRWHTAKAWSSHLPKAFVDAEFEFYEKVLSGTQELKPRWKRAMAMTESALGEALGKLYCAKFFDEGCKAKALTIVENVRAALEGRLREVDWMLSDSTREAALLKMGRFKIKIGYPDVWIDYSPFAPAAGDSFVEMGIKSHAFEVRRENAEMNAPTDRTKWFMTPQTINAYYHPSLNEIVFPAAILQPPFFNPEADDAVNYGAMGAIVGHEMTHGFDDQGRKYDAEGNMEDWWTEADGVEYEKRVEVMVKQASAFEVHGMPLQGKLTCGENIADLGGLRLAYRALKAQPDFDDTVKIGGFTPTQRFFLAWGTAWRQNIGKERALQLVTLDPHGPNEFRCNGPLSNIAEFISAFAVPEGAPMNKPLAARVDIW